MEMCSKNKFALRMEEKYLSKLREMLPRKALKE